MSRADSAFADRLKALLKKAGYTQADLARLAEVDQSSISRYLRGECEPNLRQVRSIARALKVSPSLLLGDTVELVAVYSKGKTFLFKADRCVGEIKGDGLDGLLQLRHIAASDQVGRKLLEQLQDGATRKPRSR